MKNKINDIQEYVELTNIKPDCKAKDVKELCKSASEGYCRSVVVNPEWVHLARTTLKNLGREDIIVVQVYGFPTSNVDLVDGDEVDVFIKIKGLSKNKRLTQTAEKLVDLALRRIESQGVSRDKIKAVIETKVLPEKDVIAICRILCKLKIGYIKSSTGLFDRTNNRTNLQDLKLIKKGVKIFGVGRKYLGMYQPKIKISGGIRTKEDAIELLKNGADLVGTSKVLK